MADNFPHFSVEEQIKTFFIRNLKEYWPEIYCLVILILIWATV